MCNHFMKMNKRSVIRGRRGRLFKSWTLPGVDMDRPVPSQADKTTEALVLVCLEILRSSRASAGSNF